MTESTGRVAVVTGAGSGIGAACAQALAADGWTVLLAGRRAAALEAVAASGRGVLEPVPTDVTDEASVRALFDTAVTDHGRVDLLFNNAGRGTPALEPDQLSLELWRAVVDVNLTGVFL